jgi:hypothetical protein
MVIQKQKENPAELFLSYAEKLLEAAENSEKKNQKLEDQIIKNSEAINSILQRLAVSDKIAELKKERDDAIEMVKRKGDEDLEKMKKTGMTIAEKIIAFIAFMITIAVSIWGKMKGAG